MHPKTTLLPVAATALTVAFVALAWSEAAAAPSCKPRSEGTGCALPQAAKYTGKLADGGTISVHRDTRDAAFVVEIIPTGGCAPARGSIGRKVLAKSVKVGKSFRIVESTLTRVAINDLDGTLKISSAKKATFTGTWTSYKLGQGRRKAMPLEVLCERTVAASATRSR